MKQYLDLCSYILHAGELTQNRTGVDTLNIFGAMMQYDLREGFPLLTTKRVNFDTVVDELLWFIRGGHNVKDADAPKVIWDAWANEEGELGRIYGVQWREWKGCLFDKSNTAFGARSYDQLTLAIERVKKTPNNRRNLVSAWNVAELEQGLIGFPPCHVLFQLRVMGEGTRLDMSMYQRSCDMALGVPFNIASYAILLTLIANECCLVPGILTHFLADAHIYTTHIEQMEKQLKRQPYPLPTLDLVVDGGTPAGVPVVRIAKQDIQLRNYQSHGFLKYDIAV